MTRRQLLAPGVVALLLAVAIHTDWHLARPEHHRLSLGLRGHWTLAVPVFALVAWYVKRNWATQAGRASVAIIGSATIVAGLIEPAIEYFVLRAPYAWAFGADRFAALGAFVGTGLVAYLVTLAGMGRRRDSPTTTQDPST